MCYLKLLSLMSWLLNAFVLKRLPFGVPAAKLAK
jgi:hypothetical protein